MADLSQNIEQAAEDPKSHTVDGEKAESRPIPELIAADHHLRQVDSAKGKRSGLGFFKVVSGGSVSRSRSRDP